MVRIEVVHAAVGRPAFALVIVDVGVVECVAGAPPEVHPAARNMAPSTASNAQPNLARDIQESPLFSLIVTNRELND
jgi:hypothetical protein